GVQIAQADSRDADARVLYAAAECFLQDHLKHSSRRDLGTLIQRRYHHRIPEARLDPLGLPKLAEPLIDRERIRREAAIARDCAPQIQRSKLVANAESFHAEES